MDNFDPEDVDAIASIAPCSSVLDSHVGLLLAEEWGKDITTVFAEKKLAIIQGEDGPKLVEPLAFKRDYDQMLEGKKGIVVEHIVTTAKTLLEYFDLLRAIKRFTIMGSTAVVNRKPQLVTAEYLNAGKWLPLIEKEVPSWPEEDCVLCDDVETSPIRTDLGKGEKSLLEQTAKASNG